MERYEQFLAQHPRVRRGAGLSGAALAIIGVAGLPSDLENWNLAFQTIGSEAGRWIFLVAGLLAITAYLASRSPKGVSASQGDVRSPAKPKGHSPAERRERLGNLSHSPPDHERVPGRIYGGHAVGAAIMRNAEKEEARAVYEAVEGEIALAHEEALHMAKLLRAEWPHLTPEGAVIQLMLPDWRAKTTAFIGAVLGSAHRAAFKGAEVGSTVLERLESEGRFLSDLALNLKADSIRVDKAEVLSARSARRDNEAASLFTYDDHRAPGSLPKAAVNEEEESPTQGLPPLADQLDALMREGMALLDELMAPPQAEETGEGEWALEFGDAPPEWNDKANAFYKTIKDLLAAEHPALIPDFEKGYNERLRIQREREKRKVASRQPDNRSQAQRMLDFATDTQRTPAKVVEACLEGLSYARKAI